MKKIKKNEGFTLIELLVVVAIIAILALVVLLALNPVELARRSRDSRRLSDLSTLRKAIDLSLADGKTLQVVSKTTSGGGSVLTASDATNNLVGMDISKYISTIPQDPSYLSTTATQVTAGTSCTAATPGTESKAVGAMVYSFKSDGNTYELNSFLESNNNCQTVANDGGNAADVYELGTSAGLVLLP